MNMEGAARTATLRTAPVIEVFRFDKLFVTVRNERIHALHDISLAVGEREFVTIVGPSGCGKSTLLRIVAGLLDYGQRGRSCWTASRSGGTRRDVGMVFQSSILLPWRTILENVMLPAEVLGRPKQPRERGRASCCTWSGSKASSTSCRASCRGGMQQRASIARALAARPEDPADGRALRRARRDDARADEPRAAAHLDARAARPWC